jgi:D-psicose/D-tagatose/L-ribulose 3-epimerase
MKYGVHCYMFTSQWSDSSLGILDKVAELGAECFEISVGDDVRFDPSPTRRRALALGLDLTVGPGGYWPVDCDLSADDAVDRRKGLLWHRRQVDLAEELGAVAYCGAMYGHPGTVKRRVPPPDEYCHIAEGLHDLAEYAQRRGVAIVLEPMSHFRTHVVNTPEQLMQLLAMADHSNLYALLDTYHLVTEIRDYGRAIRTVSTRLWGIHACENDRGVPGGGLVPWDAVFATLLDLGFDGYILLETYNSSLDGFAHQRGMFHNVCPDGYAFARRGLAFVRAGLTGSGPPPPQASRLGETSAC